MIYFSCYSHGYLRHFLRATLLACIDETGAWDSRRDSSITGTANTLLTLSRLLTNVMARLDRRLSVYC